VETHLQFKSIQFGWNDRSAIQTTLKSVKLSRRSRLRVKARKAEEQHHHAVQHRPTVRHARSRLIGTA
jgi:hypothetical protein